MPSFREKNIKLIIFLISFLSLIIGGWFFGTSRISLARSQVELETLREKYLQEFIHCGVKERAEQAMNSPLGASWGGWPDSEWGKIAAIKPECSDGLDNDGDGLIDLSDPGCSDPNDNDETDEITPPGALCGNGQCDPGESCQTCPQDCGECPLPPSLPQPALWGGLLGQLKCFEEKYQTSFDEILVFLKAIEGLEQISLNLDQIQKNVYQIKPTLKIPAFQLGRVEDILAGKSAFLGGESFKEFRENIWQNPLTYLEDLFSKIGDFLGEIKRILAEIAQKTEPGELLEAFSQETKDLEEKTNRLSRLVFGETNLREGCRVLDLVLKSNPDYIREQCEKIAPVEIDSQIEQNCEDYLKIVASLKARFSERWSRYFKRICDNSSHFFTELLVWERAPVKKAFCGFPPCQMPAVCPSEWEIYRNCLNDIPSKLNAICQEDLPQQCLAWQEQRLLEKNCQWFFLLEKALKDECPGNGDCIKIGEIRDTLRCQGKRPYKLCDYCPSWGREIPSDLLEDEDPQEPGFQNEKLTQAREICAEQVLNLRTPLEEVMNVLSVLLALKSGTLLYRGIKTSWQAAKSFYENLQKVITAIKELPEKIKQASADKLSDIGGGLSLEPIQCIAQPAIGWQGQTGPGGGPVCPRIDYLFSLIESNFGLIRQLLVEIDLIRREKKLVDLGLGGITTSLLATYPIKYHFLNPLYQEAKEIKKRAQDLWALGTAINFASENCLCGQSYCKIPFCISGIPLTLSPLKDPYCYLVYILRYPFLKQVKTLENYLK